MHFRGFGASEWINLDSELVLFFGPNGYGKTSLAEAIEWLVYGKTRRREKGDDYNRIEYRGSYRNAHAPDSEATSVSARVRLRDGTEHTLERILTVGVYGADDVSQLRIDGTEASLGSIGVDAKEVFYPVIVQHGLQDFIHTRPIDRRNVISAALGLELLVQFKSAFEQGRNSFRNSPPASVNAALNRIRQVGSRLDILPALASLRDRWASDQYEPVRDYREVLEQVRVTLGGDTSTTDDNALVRLRARKRIVSAAVFDIDVIRPAADQDRLLQYLEQARSRADGELESLREAATKFLRQATSAYREELFRFWEQGLQLVTDRQDDLCPMCENLTLTAAKKAELLGRIRSNEAYRSAFRALESSAQNAVRAVSSLCDAVGALARPDLSEGQKRILQTLFQDDPTQITPLIKAVEECLSVKKSASTGYTRLVELLRRTLGRVENGRAKNRMVASVDAMRKRITERHSVLVGVWKRYPAEFAGADSQIVGRISSTEAVRDIDTLIELIEVREDVEVLAVFQRLLREMLEDLRSVEEFIQSKQTEMFSSRGTEIQGWYDDMCPGADVRYSGMEAVTDAIKLYAESFGQRINAAPCLSQCQLNCVGLSVYLMRATSPDSPFGFVILDDPVQSMDDEHCESFIANVIGKLLENNGKQVIVLTHLDAITDRLRVLHRHRRILRYRIDHYDRSGPSIATYDSLDRELREIASLSDGNEDNRKLAVQKLRPSIERIVRELHLKEVGTSLDASYSSATAAQLLTAFRQIPNTTPPEHQGLRDTVMFADPSHHTEDGWQVPMKPQIIPHVDRLRQLARTKGLIQ